MKSQREKTAKISGKNDKKTVALHSLGCKVNSYESEIMLQRFREKGYEIVPFETAADVYVVNTCSVTMIADKKSRQMLRRARRLNPGALIVAVGCFVETAASDPETAELADLLLGNLQKGQIVEIVEQYLASGEKAKPRTLRQDVKEQDPVVGCSLEEAPALHTRAFIKIQDGCDQFCSYCVIPYARGRSRSRERQEITEEVRLLSAQGVREFVLTGIHVSSYGREKPGGKGFDGTNLIELIRELAALPGVERIRLSSLEPRLITRGVADAFGELCAEEKLCPHFHLSLQSGCDTVLKRMNRHYTAAEYAEGVALLRERIDQPAITTDVIAGFPGETEEEFAQTYAFLEALDFYEIHVFPYSRRKGTVAAGLSGQVPRALKQERCARLLALTALQAKRYREQFLEKTARVLWEEERPVNGVRYLTGHTARYITAALPLTEAAAAGIMPGEITACRLIRLLDDETVLAIPPSFR